ncbi:MAG: heme-copper oxidase subunit III [Acidimicrobiia bacterium]
MADAMAVAGHAPADPMDTTTNIPSVKLGMWVFLGSECMLFGGLISTYLLYKGRVPAGGIQPRDVFDIWFTSASSFVLLMSSLTMVLALSAIQRGDIARLKLWLLTTGLLGSTFIAGQVYEFTAFYREGLGFTTNIFASAFYTLTGFHGVHVTIGIVMLFSLLILAMRGKLDERRSVAVETVGLYWHFVDIVWILVFTIVYLIP